MARVVFFLLLMPFAAVAANNDDGYVWVDANTKIRLKPIGGAAAAGATAPEPQKAPEQPQKARKKEKTPK